MSNSYSQNKEDLFVLNYFKDFRGTLLEVGSNDGSMLSNSLLLIEKGWKAHLLEPGETCVELMYLHEKNDNVIVHNFGIGESNGKVKFYESANHVPGGSDKGLVSTVWFEETERWRKAGVQFKETEIMLYDFKTFWEGVGKIQFDFISIDAEGFDWQILRQIDLIAVGCKCLCIEHNGDSNLISAFTNYCMGHDMLEALRNNENLIFVR